MIRGGCEGGLAAERVCLGQRLLPFLSVSLGPRFKDMLSKQVTGEGWRHDVSGLSGPHLSQGLSMSWPHLPILLLCHWLSAS